MPDFFVSVDLGQSGDYTAISTVKRSLLLDATGLPERDHRALPKYQLTVKALTRFDLGTSYTSIVASVVGLMGRPEIQARPKLILDASGVGAPVVDLFLDKLRDVEVIPLIITGGDTVRRDRWQHTRAMGWWVPKHELASAVQAGLNTERLKVVPKLKLAELLRKELLSFQIKISAAGNEQFAAREGVHDDMVLSVAMACFLAGRREMPYRTTAESDPDRKALTAEREAEEAAERAAHAKREKAEAERLQKDHLSRYGWHSTPLTLFATCLFT